MAGCQTPCSQSKSQLTPDNYLASYLRFGDRQAGIGLIYDPFDETYVYNVYCLETKLLKELFSLEVEDLDEALGVVEQEFGTWTLETFDAASGCGSCVAKKN